MIGWIVGGVIVLGIYLIYRHYQFEPAYIDQFGYQRNGYGQLIHRKVAYKYLYTSDMGRFSQYIVHHKDRNKLNNSPENLQIMMQLEHSKVHGL